MMTICKRFGLLMGVVLLLPVGAQTASEQSEWQHQMSIGMTAFNDCRDADALMSFQAAMRIAEVFGSEHPAVGSTLNALALYQSGQGRYTEAESLYEQALAVYESTLEPGDNLIFWTLKKLVLHYRAEGRHSEAENLDRRANLLFAESSLALAEQNMGRDSPWVAESVVTLARAYADQKRFIDALAMYERALAMMEQTHGPDHRNTAAVLNDMADLYRHQGRYDKAESSSKRAFAVFEHWFGPDHEGAATSRKILADINYDRGRDDEARASYAQLLPIWERRYKNTLALMRRGFDYADVPENARVLEWYPQMLRRAGRVADATALEASANEIWVEEAKKKRAQHKTRCAHNAG